MRSCARPAARSRCSTAICAGDRGAAPHVAVVTPNLDEATVLAGGPAHPHARILSLGLPAVLVKGGHADDPDHADDVLVTAAGATRLAGARGCRRRRRSTALAARCRRRSPVGSPSATTSRRRAGRPRPGSPTACARAGVAGIAAAAAVI
ncbi:MAG: bifunctional hydroxymethylpyrimidine kinase/phosphomethylpyrimidine kinase [Kofleriaceae bacterium]